MEPQAVTKLPENKLLQIIESDSPREGGTESGLAGKARLGVLPKQWQSKIDQIRTPSEPPGQQCPLDNFLLPESKDKKMKGFIKRWRGK